MKGMTKTLLAVITTGFLVASVAGAAMAATGTSAMDGGIGEGNLVPSLLAGYAACDQAV